MTDHGPNWGNSGQDPESEEAPGDDAPAGGAPEVEDSPPAESEAESPAVPVVDQEPAAVVGDNPESAAGDEDNPVGAMETALHGDHNIDDNGAAPGGAAAEPPEVETSGQETVTSELAEPEEREAATSEGAGPEIDLPVGSGLADVEAVGQAPSTPRSLPRVLAVANQKGGVGKTTTTVNLGAALAESGYRVLVCDLDPQGNASTGLGLNPREMAASMYDVILHGMALEDCIEPTSVRNLFVAPASLDLAGAEIELVPAFSRELRLKRAIDAVVDDYDFVLIDCPPSLGLLTVNGLAAAHEVLVPIQCEYYALEGLGQLLRNVNLVQRNLNPTLELSTIICVMYDARTKLSDQVVQEVRAHFGDKVCRNVVPRTVRLSEAPSFGQPITTFDPTSRGAIAYRELAKEVSGGAPQRTG